MLRKSIMLPPPNVTGSLHIGHAFQQVLMDIYARHQRSLGHDIEWIAGFDHAGIALSSWIDSHTDLTDVADKIVHGHQVSKKHRSAITYQMQRLCLSIDWTKQYYTLDDNFSKAVLVGFDRLKESGLIYKGSRPVYWDSIAETVLSDSEVVYKEAETVSYDIKYSSDLIVTTTRPETLFGDTALAVHPTDERYKHLIGSQVKVPLTDRYIPVIESPLVEPDKGTGCMKITPAHDLLDSAIAREHQLDYIDLYDHTLRFNKNAFLCNDLCIDQGRTIVVNRLKSLGLITSSRVITHSTPHSDRTGVALEVIRTPQWFVRASVMAKKALPMLDRVTFLPGRWKKQCTDYLNNMNDWCISRQIWWGHPLPGDHGHVLDTWFSSALCPLVLSGWPDTKQPKTFDILVTGFDILFFWICRMIMFSGHFSSSLPFRKIVITGLIKDDKGEKMSKTRGNVINPLDIIDGTDNTESYGVDVLRLSLALFFSDNNECNFRKITLDKCKRFKHKIINAAKFTQTCVLKANTSTQEQHYIHDDFIRRSYDFRQNFSSYMEDFKIRNAAQLLIDFVYNDLCSWYIDAYKVIPSNLHAISIVWNTILPPLSCFMPMLAQKISYELHPLLKSVSPDKVQTLRGFIDSIRTLAKRNDISVSVEKGGVVNEDNVQLCSSLTKRKIILVEHLTHCSHTVVDTRISITSSKSIMSQVEKDNVLASINKIKGILCNSDFMTNAPQTVIDSMKAKLRKLESCIASTSE